MLNWIKRHKKGFICSLVFFVLGYVIANIGFVFSQDYSVWYLRKLIDNYYVDDVSYDKLREYTLDGIVRSLEDEHSVYIPEEYGIDNFEKYVTGEFVGIGISVRSCEDGILVEEVYNNTPAQKNGILEGDIITSISGESMKGKTTEAAVHLISGKENTSFDMELLRNDEVIKVNGILRQKVYIESLSFKTLEDNIGYIKIDMFDSDTDKELKNALNMLKDTKSLIIDLRDNPGGQLDVVLNCIDLFIDKQLVLTAKYKNDKKDEMFSTDGIEYSSRVCVLVNENSASASEIFSSVIKESGRGKVVGVNTYGKGSIQRTFILPNNAGANFTIGKFYSPKGNSIDKKGVLPDIVVEMPEELKDKDIKLLSIQEDVQLKKAIEIIK